MTRTRYEESLSHHTDTMYEDIADLHSNLCAIFTALQHPHQDDWDDAIGYASAQIREAVYYLNKATKILEET